MSRWKDELILRTIWAGSAGGMTGWEIADAGEGLRRGTIYMHLGSLATRGLVKYAERPGYYRITVEGIRELQ